MNIEYVLYLDLWVKLTVCLYPVLHNVALSYARSKAIP